ncbi:MAG: hypothetical protein ACPGUE_02270 [Marinomonas sp.]
MQSSKQGRLSKPVWNKNVIGRSLVYMTLISFLSGCIMVPKTHEFQEPKCELITKELTVGLKELDFSNRKMNPVGFIGLPFALAALFTASVVVSGSIVVAGNSIHWIEQEGICDDGKIRNAVADLSGSLVSMGGQVITSSKQLMDWLIFWKEKEEADTQQGLDLLLLENDAEPIESSADESVLEPIMLELEKNKTEAKISPGDALAVDEELVVDEQSNLVKSDDLILDNKAEN